MTVHTRPSSRSSRRLLHRLRGDHGSISVEIALSVPLVVLLLFLLTAAVHLGRAAIDVNSAAAAASRNAAAANLTGRCASLSVTVDTSGFHRGGAVTVTVACTITTHGLTGITIPGSVSSLTSRANGAVLWMAWVVGSVVIAVLSGSGAGCPTPARTGRRWWPPCSTVLTWS